MNKKVKYLGIKIVEAEPMLESEAIEKGYRVGDDTDKKDEYGYEITYDNGYKSWSPKTVFDKAYKPLQGPMTFGDAVEALKAGHTVQRQGWNGKGMYLRFISNWTFTNSIDDNKDLLPFIAMKTVDDKFVPWFASQTDILAEDWSVVQESQESVDIQDNLSTLKQLPQNIIIPPDDELIHRVRVTNQDGISILDINEVNLSKMTGKKDGLIVDLSKCSIRIIPKG